MARYEGSCGWGYSNALGRTRVWSPCPRTTDEVPPPLPLMMSIRASPRFPPHFARASRKVRSPQVPSVCGERRQGRYRGWSAARRASVSTTASRLQRSARPKSTSAPPPPAPRSRAPRRAPGLQAPMMIYAVGTDGRVYKQQASLMTTSTGWTQCSQPTVRGIAFWQDYIYAVGTDGRVYKQQASLMTTSTGWTQCSQPT
eukprot:gene19391-biopygen40909